ncbi:PhzF family phenazine biosynthesis protein [Acidaminobacter hydrogenoformans]|uniref:Phenazine biosynthesis protein PhzF family n=1 Tax=Acidaminobacter hydrogenoformans DSM 2784 TaxID=1120920 RepID=A0A1G5S2Q3_9FIRM|nr:PhzF family phenazine biosynthesis protein [Acidaminobacter hydrogenoformans]SCZ80576.1 phenazine biosynthesis protein PhzF family [Acidaminobacter hydrogenoformans DSM 2784]
MKVHIYEVHAFTQDGQGGNAAGVVIQSEDAMLTEQQMLKVAARMGFSETAFVSESDMADFKVRFFTPSDEVALCGHATIAVFSLLQKLGRLNGRRDFVQETKAGLLRIKADAEEILMAQVAPDFGPILEPEEIFWSLGLSEDFQAAGLPVQIVSTGLRDILVPVSSLKALKEMQPDFEDIRQISEAHGVTGYHCFTLETGTSTGNPGQPSVTAWCRNFAPLFGIDEESATGTSNGALAAYLSAYGAVRGNDMRFVQGMWMNKPSLIKARTVWSSTARQAGGDKLEESGLVPNVPLDPEGAHENDIDTLGSKLQTVWVGGSASIKGETELEI